VGTFEPTRDDSLYKLLGQLDSDFPGISEERLRWAVNLVKGRAKTPPKSVGFFLKSLPGVFDQLEAETSGWLTQQAERRMVESGNGLRRPDLAEELKVLAAHSDLPYSEETVHAAIDAAERRLEKQGQLRSALTVGRGPTASRSPRGL